MSADGKESNPKDAAGSTRAPLHLIPLPAWVQMSLALFEGGSKYGFWNWTAAGVRSSVYVAAAARHVFKWFFGEEYETWTDPDTGETVQLAHHLGYAMACCAILLDAQHRDKLVDDRPPALPHMRELLAQAEQTVKHMIQAFGHNRPRHYTIKDSQ